MPDKLSRAIAEKMIEDASRTTKHQMALYVMYRDDSIPSPIMQRCDGSWCVWCGRNTAYWFVRQRGYNYDDKMGVWRK